MYLILAPVKKKDVVLIDPWVCMGKDFKILNQSVPKGRETSLSHHEITAVLLPHAL